jgi:hypothetical protein
MKEETNEQTPENVNTETNDTAPVKPDFGGAYVTALRLMEKVQVNTVDKDPNADTANTADAISAAEILADLIEAMALYGCALDVVLRETLSVLDTTSPKTASLKAVSEQISMAYYAERAFCTNMERMVRARILEQAGIDPDDKAAEMEFFSKVGRNVVFASGSKEN